MENIRKVLKYIEKVWRRVKRQIRNIHLNQKQKIMIAATVCVAVVGITALLILISNDKEKNPSGGKLVVDITEKEDADEENDVKIEIPLEERQAAEVPEVDEGDPYNAVQEQKNIEQGASVHIKDVIFNSMGEKIAHGIDVSKYQGTIKWKEVAESGIQFAMIRVGYRTMVTGKIQEDSYAKYNIQEAIKHGIKVGVYFYSAAVTEQEAIEEANFVLDIIKGYQITYPVAYDCEGYQDESNRHANISESRRTDNALAFMKQIAAKGYTSLFYGSQSHLDESEYWEVDRISSLYGIWIAQYPAKPYPATPEAKFSGEYVMWQYTNKGVVSGIGTEVDLNVSTIEIEETQILPDANPEVPPTVSRPVAMLFETVDEQVTAKDETNLRDKPSQTEDSQILYTLLNGQVAKRTGINADTGWSRIEYDGKVCYAVSSFLTTDLNYKKPQEEQSNIQTQFQTVNEQMTPKEEINLRNIPSLTREDSQVVVTITKGQIVTCTGINTDVGWSRVVYNGQTLYCVSSYLEPVTVTEQNETQ